MLQIFNIKKTFFDKNNFCFHGQMRNQRRFNMGDEPFLLNTNGEILRVKIIGVEQTIDLNPTFIYKVIIPNVSENITQMDCDNLFSTKQQLMDFILNDIEFKYKRAIKDANQYFELIK